MFPSEVTVLNAIRKNRRWPEWIANARDIPGVYIHLMVHSLMRRGLVKRAWRGGYCLTEAGRKRLLTVGYRTEEEPAALTAQ